MGMKRPSHSPAQNLLAYKPPLAVLREAAENRPWAVITAIMFAAASAVR